MMTFDEAVVAFLRRTHPSLADGTVSGIRLTHEDGWVDEESGTDWPEHTLVGYSLTKDGVSQPMTVSAGDSVEFARALVAIGAEDRILTDEVDQREKRKAAMQARTRIAEIEAES